MDAALLALDEALEDVRQAAGGMTSPGGGVAEGSGVSVSAITSGKSIGKQPVGRRLRALGRDHPARRVTGRPRAGASRTRLRGGRTGC
jgi:hypothetical protein